MNEDNPSFEKNYEFLNKAIDRLSEKGILCFRTQYPPIIFLEVLKGKLNDDKKKIGALFVVNKKKELCPEDRVLSIYYIANKHAQITHDKVADMIIKALKKAGCSNSIYKSPWNRIIFDMGVEYRLDNEKVVNKKKR